MQVEDSIGVYKGTDLRNSRKQIAEQREKNDTTTSEKSRSVNVYKI